MTTPITFNKIGNIITIPELLSSTLEPLLEDLHDFLSEYPFIQFQAEVLIINGKIREPFDCRMSLYPVVAYNPVGLNQVRDRIKKNSTVENILDTDLDYRYTLALLNDFKGKSFVYHDSDISVTTQLSQEKPAAIGTMLVGVADGFLDGPSVIKMPKITVSLEYELGILLQANQIRVEKDFQYESIVTFDEDERPVTEQMVTYKNGKSLSEERNLIKYDGNNKIIQSVVYDKINHTEKRSLRTESISRLIQN